MAATSSFVTAVDEEECMGCGDCIDRCPMEALSMQDEIAVMDANRCIGCGLCISACSTGALRLEAREDAPIPPLEFKALNAAIMESVLKKPQ
jgi:electron transport complex protein RnfB